MRDHATAPSVCIVILQWGKADETTQCLRSLEALDYPNFRVLVVDNDSGGDAVEVITRQFPDLEILVNPENLGFAGGCNAGIAAALADPQLEYILLLNNDTRASATFLREMVAVAQIDSAVAVVGAINRRGAGHTSSGGFIRWWTGRYVDLLDERPWSEIRQQAAFEVDAVSGSSMLVRAAPLRAGVRLDPDFFCVFEETDWCLRLRARGGRVMLATRACVEHGVAATMGRPLQLYYRFRNRPYFMYKHARPWHWLAFLPWYAVETVARVVGYAFFGRRPEARAVLLGAWDAARLRRGRGRLDALVSRPDH